MISAMKDNFGRITDNHLLCLIRHSQVSKVVFMTTRKLSFIASFYRFHSSFVIISETTQGDFGVNRLQLTMANGKHLFSSQAYEAFRSAIQDKKEDGLKQMFGLFQIHFYRKRFGLEPDYTNELPPKDEVDFMLKMMRALVDEDSP